MVSAFRALSELYNQSDGQLRDLGIEREIAQESCLTRARQIENTIGYACSLRGVMGLPCTVVRPAQWTRMRKVSDNMESVDVTPIGE